MPLSSARSVPGLICRNRSAFVGGRGAARVDDDQLGAGLEPVGHPQEQDRMAVGHVGADDEEQVGAVEVGVGTRAGRPHRATACSRCPRWPCTAGSSTRCARCAGSPWPAWSPDTAPRCDIWPDTYSATASGPCSSTMARSRAAGLGDGVVDVDGHRVRVARRAAPAPCVNRPSVGGHHLGVRGTLGAQPPEVGGVQLVSGHPRDDGRARRRGRCGSRPRCRSRHRSTSTRFGS